ncbi:MAG: AgmX/PglI C-terminal domain-containing protein [Myxococcales bacterium]|nr:AgmX/PglI C-terminal domain-containing protein [Myxococcales bacterium]
MALDTNRVLRIGVVYRGQILAERVLDRRIDVTVGSKADSTVQISADVHPDFPASVSLAVLHKEAYHLLLPEDPSIQLNLRGGPSGGSGFSDSDVVKVKGKRAVAIEGYTGGSLALGDIILMFQFVRGDSVPTETREETVLRIGLVFESRLLSDQIFQAGETVRVGSGKDDRIVLPDTDYKGERAVFKVGKDGKVAVTLPAASKLRLAADGAPMNEQDAISKGIARKAGNGLDLTIGLKSRGRASLGPYTLLFQVVRRTITVPVMPRKSLIGQIMQPLTSDPVWSVSFLVSVLLIGSIVSQAVIFQRTTGKYLKSQRLEEEHIATTYEVVIEEKEEEPPPEKVQDVKSNEAKKAEQEEIKREKKPKKKRPAKVEKPQSTGKTVDLEKRKRNARKVVAKRTIAGALLGKGGAATKLFAEGGEGDTAVIAKTFGGDSGAGEGGDGPGKGIQLAGGGGGGGTVEQVKAGSSKGFGSRKKIATKKKIKREKKVRISLSAGALGGSGAGKSGVARVIARKNSAVRRCYESALRKTPGLSGKVKVRFTVGTAGTITAVTVIGASGDFATCIKGKFRRIRGLPLLPSPQSFTQSYVFTKS